MPKYKKTYTPDNVVLLYKCPDCEEEFHQPASELDESGTAFCPECERDCELISVNIRKTKSLITFWRKCDPDCDPK